MPDLLDMRRYQKGLPIESFVSLKKLQEVYLELCVDLNTRFPQQILRTRSELRCWKKIQSSTKLSVYKSMWIGNYCIDIFVLGVRGDYNLANHFFRGLAIEVDGSIHDEEFKMRKDHSKQAFLQKLKIPLYSIKNEDLNNASFNALLMKISKLKHSDNRARKRLLRNIYLVTILSHLPDNKLEEEFGSMAMPFFKLLRKEYDK